MNIKCYKTNKRSNIKKSYNTRVKRNCI